MSNILLYVLFAEPFQGKTYLQHLPFYLSIGHPSVDRLQIWFIVCELHHALKIAEMLLAYDKIQIVSGFWRDFW